MNIRIVCVFAALAAALPAAPARDLAELRNSFVQPPDDARIMMRWWWFGPSITKAEVEHEMRLMKEGGIGGFEVQPVYPLELDDPAKGFRNVTFLSPEFLDILKFTAEKARELGLRMDLTLGSGWPYGGPHIPATQAPGRLRWDRVKPVSNRVPLPDMAHGEAFIAAFDAATRQELTNIRDGILWLTDPRPAEVWFFISSRTGQQVKRPSVGAEGFVLDHYDRNAIENHLRTVADPMLKALGPLRPYAAFCDSLEVFGSDWTSDLLPEFQRRRGYDLKPLLPVLAAGSGGEAARVRRDWGRTLTELYEERFMAPLHDWAKKNSTLLRIQNYGIPPALVSSSELADLPEGEGAQWRVVRASRWASSASHIYGRPVTSSETWTWLHSPSFRATPLDIKAEADIHFIQGINQLIGHGWPYSDPGAPYPGWRFYAAGVFNDKNPWWVAMPDLALYLQRVSYLLRQGKPANDVALYLPNEDAWARFTPGRVHMIETLRELVGPDLIGRILDAGYNLDFFDDRVLATRGRIENDRLFLGDNGYRIVVLPGAESIPPATMRKLEEFMQGGGVVIAARRSAGSARFVQDEAQLGAALNQAVTPDLRLSPANAEVGFIHRSTGFGEVYFVANTGNARWNGRAAFRAGGLSPQSWDTRTGAVTGIEVVERASSAVTIALHLEPYESRAIVFAKEPLPVSTVPAAARSVVADLSAGWTVKFGDSAAVPMPRLRSWTAEESTRFFSGAATYEREFTLDSRPRILELDFGEGTALPARTLPNGTRAWLEGPVREAAVVYVNGQRAGAVWCPPYRLDISKFVKTGSNQLRIVVGNLALNAMAGKPLPNYRLLNARYGVRFEPQDMDKVQPIEAGLVGSIRLMEAR